MRKLIFDLGAHWGESICFFSKSLSDPENWNIISVEASNLNFKKLENNSLNYSSFFKKIELHNKFVFHKNQNIYFYEYIDEFHSAGSTYSKEKFDFNSRKKPEYANLAHNIINPSIFNICSEYKKACKTASEIIIKMDIEGAEYEILPELIKLLNPSKTKYFYLEFHANRVGIDPSLDEKYRSQISSLGIVTKELNNIQI
jgi:FkbM family methyltransferase